MKKWKQGYFYILKCANGTFYCGSTYDLPRRLQQHQNGEGANYTRKHGPVELVYYEHFPRVDEAFYREKQVQKWSQAKKRALIESRVLDLRLLSKKKFER